MPIRSMSRLCYTRVQMVALQIIPPNTQPDSFILFGPAG